AGVEAGTVKVTVTVALPPAAIVPRSQVKSEPTPVGVQVPCDGVIVPWVKPLGQVSLSVVPVASDGPALLTVIVYVCVMPSPATTVERPSSLVTDSVAVVRTVLVSLAVLFVVSGSVTSLETVTVSVCGPAGVEAGTV